MRCTRHCCYAIYTVWRVHLPQEGSHFPLRHFGKGTPDTYFTGSIFSMTPVYSRLWSRILKPSRPHAHAWAIIFSQAASSIVCTSSQKVTLWKMKYCKDVLVGIGMIHVQCNLIVQSLFQPFHNLSNLNIMGWYIYIHIIAHRCCLWTHIKHVKTAWKFALMLLVWYPVHCTSS